MGGDIAKWITGINKLKEKRSLIPWREREPLRKFRLSVLLWVRPPITLC